MDSTVAVPDAKEVSDGAKAAGSLLGEGISEDRDEDFSTCEI